MSQSMHLCCLDCKEDIWIGQRDSLYSGESHTMEGLRQFLVKHRTLYVPRSEGTDYHELVYVPEPYNEYIKDYCKDNWESWDTDDFRLNEGDTK